MSLSAGDRCQRDHRGPSLLEPVQGPCRPVRRPSGFGRSRPSPSSGRDPPRAGRRSPQPWAWPASASGEAALALGRRARGSDPGRPALRRTATRSAPVPGAPTPTRWPSSTSAARSAAPSDCASSTQAPCPRSPPAHLPRLRHDGRARSRPSRLRLPLNGPRACWYPASSGTARVMNPQTAPHPPPNPPDR